MTIGLYCATMMFGLCVLKRFLFLVLPAISDIWNGYTKFPNIFSTKSMWYEQIYSSIVTVGCVAIALFTMLPINLIETGHAHRRHMYGYMIFQNKRDQNLTGSMYKVQGLESIPSESSSSS
ncbi:High affinity choline transporter [Dirofilaria immitis]